MAINYNSSVASIIAGIELRLVAAEAAAGGGTSPPAPSPSPSPAPAPSNPTTLNASIVPPYYTFPNNTAHPPILDFVLNETINPDDIVVVQVSASREFTSLLMTLEYPLTTANIAGSDPVAVKSELNNVPQPPIGTYFRPRIHRGNAYSPWGKIRKFGDTVAPVFTNEMVVTTPENSPVAITLTTNEFTTLSVESTFDGALFEIVGGTLRMVNNNTPNREVDAQYVVSVKAVDDSGNITRVTITINISDVAEAGPQGMNPFDKLNTVVISANGLDLTGANNYGEIQGARSVNQIPPDSDIVVFLTMISPRSNGPANTQFGFGIVNSLYPMDTYGSVARGGAHNNGVTIHQDEYVYTGAGDPDYFGGLAVNDVAMMRVKRPAVGKPTVQFGKNGAWQPTIYTPAAEMADVFVFAGVTQDQVIRMTFAEPFPYPLPAGATGS